MSEFIEEHFVWASVITVFVLIVVFALFGFTGDFSTNILPLVYRILFIISPIIIPLVLIYILVLLWVRYVQMKYIAGLKSFLFEIKIPKDIQKSPLAMEIVLGYMYASGAATYTEAYLLGKVVGWFSLELVSIDGQVHFYIWSSEPKFKKILEAQIYAQYPTVEVHEVPPEKDYANQFVYDPKKNGIWGIQYKLSKPDSYPIKTYIDYGMDKDQKDEYRIDPMTAILEFLGSAGKGQQLWMQILIRKHGEEGWKEHRLKKKVDWTVAAKKEIEKIRKEATPPPKEGQLYPGFPNPTKGQVETIAAIERSLSKLSFDTMVRGFYLADAKVFSPVYISGLLTAMKQYSSKSLNGFSTGKFTDTSDPYKDWCTLFPFLKKGRDAQQEKYKRLMFNAYRLRSFFYPPYKNHRGKSFILNTEEVATMYHFPGNVSATSTLTKIPSKRSEPPSNLPIKK